MLRNSSVNFGKITVGVIMEPRTSFGIATVSVHLVQSFFYLVIISNLSHILGSKMTYIMLQHYRDVMNISLATSQCFCCSSSCEKVKKVSNRRPLQCLVGILSKYSLSEQSQLLLNVHNETEYAILLQHHQDILVAILSFFS